MSATGRPSEPATLWSLIREAWLNTPTLLRKLAWRLWVVGLVGMAVSIVADVRGWWGNLSFTENLVSEIVSSLVALPVAILIINRLSAYQAEVASRVRLERVVRAARHRTHQTVQNLRDTVSVIHAEVGAATDQLVSTIEHGADGAAEHLAQLGRLMDRDERRLLTEAVAPVKRNVKELERNMTELNHDGEFSERIDDFSARSSDLVTAVAQLRSDMEREQPTFADITAIPSSEHTSHRLRNTAIEYVESLTRLLDLCDEVASLLAAD